MPIVKQKEWDHTVEINTDSYGGACVKIARKVMEILDAEADPIADIDKLISRAEHEVGENGITGFMAGCIAQMVSQCHSRGDEFRRMWNSSYGVTEEKAQGGVVNPAIVTIGK
jgi:hypothetical protein